MSSAMPDDPLRGLLDASRRYGRYEVLEQIGRGGMGAVYLARVQLSEGFEKRFALKVAHPALARDPSFARRFSAEARLAAQLDHPNVCAVVDFGSAHGGHYLVMELLRGQSLQAVLRRVEGPIPMDIACRVVCDAARGIHAAHELRGEDGGLAGVVHRDLKPANLFLRDDGVTKVLDFGIARWDDPLGREHTGVGVLRGSSGYMAPEQTRPGPVDRRTDIYALGVVLWEATVGRRLFRGGSTDETLHLMREAIVPRPGALRPGYPPALERVVLRCLAREPSARYESAAALADALESVLLGLGTVGGLGRVAAWLASAGSDSERDEAFTDGSGAVDVRVANDASAPEAPRPPAPSSAAASPPSDTRGPSTSAAMRLALAAVTLAILALGVAVWAVLTRSEPGPRTASGIAPPATAAPTPTAAPPPTPAPTPTAAPPPTPAPPRTAAPPADEVQRAAPARASSPPHAPRPPRGPAVATVASPLATPTAAPVTTAMGDVNIMAWPSSAEVSEGGRTLGSTPIAHLRLPVGRHRLTLRPHDGGSPRTIEVDVHPNTRAIVRERW